MSAQVLSARGISRLHALGPAAHHQPTAHRAKSGRVALFTPAASAPLPEPEDGDRRVWLKYTVALVSAARSRGGSVCTLCDLGSSDDL